MLVAYTHSGGKTVRPPVTPPLSHRTKLGYGAADWGLAAVESMLQIYLFKFYNVTVGLPALYTGLALALAIVWGRHHRSPHGRHLRPLPLVRRATTALFVARSRAVGRLSHLDFQPAHPSMATPPASPSCLISFILLNTAMTVVGVPHSALGSELSFDRNQRTQLFAYKRLFGTVGALGGLWVPGLILAQIDGHADPTGAQARGLASWWLSAPIVLCAYITVRATRGLDRPASYAQLKKPLHLWRLFADQRSVLANPFFSILLLAILFATIGRTLNAANTLYYYEYRLQLTEEETIGWILLPFFFSFLASLPVWVWVARRWSKKTAGVIGVLSLGVATAVAYPLFPVGELAPPLLYALVGGGMAGVLVLLDALVADTIDYDRLKTGLDRQGLYFGVWRMGTKLARALGLGLNGVLLWLIGFSAGTAAQTPETSWRLALLFGPVVGILFLGAGLILWCMPLTDERHQRIQRLLRRRRQRRHIP